MELRLPNRNDRTLMDFQIIPPHSVALSPCKYTFATFAAFLQMIMTLGVYDHWVSVCVNIPIPQTAIQI